MKPAPRPAVTVLMPVYNAQRFVGQAVQSILDQSLSDFEFLIIDDGSTDDTRSIIDGYPDPRIRVLRTERSGVAAALRLGLTEAGGEYIARMDADDESLPQRLHIEKQALDRDPRALLVHSRVDYIDDDGRVMRSAVGDPRTSLETKWSLLWRNVPFHPTVMMRATLLKDHGLNYRIEANWAEDFDLWNRASALGEFVFLPDVLVRYRIHGQSITRSEAVNLQLAAYADVVRDNFHRLGIPISKEVSREIAIVSGGAKIDPIRYAYRNLDDALLPLFRRISTAFAQSFAIEPGAIARTQAGQLLRWARYMLNTSARSSLELLRAGAGVAPGIVFSGVFWTVLAATLLPRRARRWIEDRRLRAMAIEPHPGPPS